MMSGTADIPVVIVSPDPFFLFAARGVLGKDRRVRIYNTVPALGMLHVEMAAIKAVVFDLDSLDLTPMFFNHLKDFLDEHPSIAVVCLAEGMIERAILYMEDIPVSAFLSKRDLGYCLHLAIHAIIDHGIILLTETIYYRLARRSYLARQGRVIDVEQSHPNLTGRIEEIAMCRMVIGLNNPDIQDELLLSSNTVRGYVSKAYQALGASSEQDAFEAMSEWWWLTRFSGVLGGSLRYAEVAISG